jgi:two-component system, OmpR family, response regulator
MKDSSPAGAEQGLDFTRPGPSAAPPPSAEAIEQARREAEAGAPQLKQAGFLVSIARRAPAKIAPRAGGKHVVLVVEDDADLGQLLIDIFMTAGFEVRWASNRAEINAEMKRGEELDIMLLDVELPDANGLQVLRQLRGHPRFAKLPVIMVTGRSEAVDVLAGLAAGADGYVTKPFKMSGLVNAVNLVLGNS